MTLTFFSNFFNHHQKPVCDIFYEKLGSNFTFISTMPMPESFAKSGYEDYSKVSYNLLAFKGEEERAKAKTLAMESDIVIFGPIPREYIMDRIKANKFTFCYLERFFKKGNYQKFDYRIILHLLKYHTKYRNYNMYLLCASAFTANDFSWVKAYPQKKIKWGYFTKVNEVNLTNIIANKDDEKIKIIFVGRLIPYKRPELVIAMAEKLKAKNISFEIEIIGSGPLADPLKLKASENDLDNHIRFSGNMPNKKVIEKMQKSNIFVFTSNREEGWGAVLNEAMANGCSVVASHVIGAAPFLIKNGSNGLIFKSGNVNDLTKKVEQLILDKALREKLAINAYQTMRNVWSPENAAKNFLTLCDSFLNNQRIKLTDGPCSQAKVTSQGWYKQTSI